MGGLGAGHKSDPPALKLRRGTQRKVPTVGTGGEDGRAGSGAQIGEGEAGATRQYKESAGGEEEGTAAMAERTGVADHRATGVAVVGGNQWRVASG